MTDDKTTRPIGYIERLLNELRARDLPVPPVLEGEAKPLALSTRTDLPVWCELHGYGNDETAVNILQKAISAHVKSGSYISALASDLSERHDLDGQPVGGPASELDRHSAKI